MRKSAIILLLALIFTNLLIFQNCGPQGGGDQLTLGSAGGGGGNTVKCGAGYYRVSPGANCIRVDDESYSPANSDIKYPCIQGASSAGTLKASQRDCRPVIVFNITEGDCVTDKRTFFPGEPYFGCVRGVAADPNSPNILACADLNGVDCLSTMNNWRTLPRLPTWRYDASKNAMISVDQSGLIGTRPLTVYTYAERPDGARAESVVQIAE